MKYFLAICIFLAPALAICGQFDDQATHKLINYLDKLAAMRREKRKYPDNMSEYIKNLVRERANPKIENDKGTCSIFFATENNDHDLCQFLLDRGEDIEVNDRDSLDRTPLHVACEKGHHELALWLIDHSANVNAVDKFRDSPLSVAAAKDNANIITSLVNFGASIEGKNKWGETSCFVAVKLAKTNALAELIRLGANINKADMLGQTPLEQAIRQRDEASTLLLLTHHANAWQGQSHPLEIAYQIKKWRNPRRLNSDPPSFFKIIYDMPAQHCIAILKTVPAFAQLPEEVIAYIVRWILAPWTTDKFILELQ